MFVYLLFSGASHLSTRLTAKKLSLNMTTPLLKEKIGYLTTSFSALYYYSKYRI